MSNTYTVRETNANLMTKVGKAYEFVPTQVWEVVDEQGKRFTQVHRSEKEAQEECDYANNGGGALMQESEDFFEEFFSGISAERQKEIDEHIAQVYARVDAERVASMPERIIVPGKYTPGEVLAFGARKYKAVSSHCYSGREVADLEDVFDLFIQEGWHTTMQEIQA